MPQANIITPQSPYAKMSVASVGASYTALDPATAPSVGVLWSTVPAVGGNNPSLLRLTPYASATGGTSVGMRVVGYNLYQGALGLDYIPSVLGDFTLTFSEGTVPTWTLDVSNDARPYAGIVQVAGTPTANLYSPGTGAASGTPPAAAVLDLIGYQYVTLQFESSTGTMGCFYSFI
jgi:hypothetical protein